VPEVIEIRSRDAIGLHRCVTAGDRLDRRARCYTPALTAGTERSSVGTARSERGTV